MCQNKAAEKRSKRQTLRTRGFLFGGNMTIHHDKLAYGKLASATEDMTEQEIADMLKALSENEEEEEKTETEKGQSGK